MPLMRVTREDLPWWNSIDVGDNVELRPPCSYDYGPPCPPGTPPDVAIKSHRPPTRIEKPAVWARLVGFISIPARGTGDQRHSPYRVFVFFCPAAGRPLHEFAGTSIPSAKELNLTADDPVLLLDATQWEIVGVNPKDADRFIANCKKYPGTEMLIGL